jgi:hypothetical protein
LLGRRKTMFNIEVKNRGPFIEFIVHKGIRGIKSEIPYILIGCIFDNNSLNIAKSDIMAVSDDVILRNIEEEFPNLLFEYDTPFVTTNNKVIFSINLVKTYNNRKRGEKIVIDVEAIKKNITNTLKKFETAVEKFKKEAKEELEKNLSIIL